jgi:hypothetical protein
MWSGAKSLIVGISWDFSCEENMRETLIAAVALVSIGTAVPAFAGDASQPGTSSASATEDQDSLIAPNGEIRHGGVGADSAAGDEQDTQADDGDRDNDSARPFWHW